MNTLIKCRSCGQEVPPNATSCPNCGRKSGNAPSIITNALIKCRACGREISPNAQSCPHCGEPQRLPEEPKQTATGLLAAIIIALLVGGFLYWAIAGL